MADIQEKILCKYNIDIAQENICKLYKIDSPNLSDNELQAAIEATRKRWNQSINGANEKNAARDRARLEKADLYEAILRDYNLRKELFAFYNGGGSGKNSSTSSGANSDSIEFAREYFKLVGTTKRINKQDVEFFFSYYKALRKNKKDITKMLSKEFKVLGLGKINENEETGKEEKKKESQKSKSNSLIVNLFQETTILKLKASVDYYNTSIQSPMICQKYPHIQDGLYYFLELNKVENIEQFSEMVAQKAQEAFAIRQEKGTEFMPMVDLFNTLNTLATSSNHKDVQDNFNEFKLLIRYPNLTPYMFSFVEMKPETMKGIVSVANREYVFRDDTDFILNYYKPVHDNFGISDGGVSSIIKKAEKKAKQNKVLNEIDEKLGRKKTRKLPFGAKLLHWLVYWPLFIIYFIFEAFKTVFTNLYKFPIPTFCVMLVGTNCLFPKIFNIENLLILRNIFSKVKWYAFLEVRLDEIKYPFDAVMYTLIVLLELVLIYILPAVFMTLFIKYFCENINKRYDWIGIERTFKNMFQKLKTKMEKEFLSNKKHYVKKRIQKAISNVVCVALLVFAIWFVGFKVDSYKSAKAEANEAKLLEEELEKEKETTCELTEAESEDDVEQETLMVITAASANIRDNPNIDGAVLTTAKKDDEFIATGNEETASNGRIWYEVYINDEKTETGWASGAVIEYK